MPSPMPMSVETYDWVDTTKLSSLVANFARAQILVTLFDGNPDKWIEFLRAEGTAEELEHDLPFALGVKRRLLIDPEHVEKIRALVQSFSKLLA